MKRLVVEMPKPNGPISYGNTLHPGIRANLLKVAANHEWTIVVQGQKWQKGAK